MFTRQTEAQGGFITCPECNGSHFRPCDDCGGGTLACVCCALEPGYPPDPDCTACNGTGYEPCGECLGTGEVWCMYCHEHPRENE